MTHRHVFFHIWIYLDVRFKLFSGVSYCQVSLIVRCLLLSNVLSYCHMYLIFRCVLFLNAFCCLMCLIVKFVLLSGVSYFQACLLANVCCQICLIVECYLYLNTLTDWYLLFQTKAKISSNRSWERWQLWWDYVRPEKEVRRSF